MSRIYIILCVFGMTTHVSIITHEYLKNMPGLSVCWRYPDLIDINSLNHDHHLRLTPPDVTDHSNNLPKLDAIERAVTLNQIFNYSPPGESIFDRSEVRFPGSSGVNVLDSNQTRDLFDVDRYYVQEYLCYRLRMKHNGTYDFQQVASSLGYARMVFMVAFDETIFRNVTIFLPTIHDLDDYPTNSILLSTQVWGSKIYIMLTYQFISIEQLPRPYSTDCHEYGRQMSQARCLTKCSITNTLDMVRKFPFSHIILESEYVKYHKTKIVHPEDLLDNVTIAKLMDQVDTKCKRQCRRPSCRTRTYLTDIVERISTRQGAKMIRVDVPASPNITIKFNSTFDLFAYVTYALSCMGTWFGVSLVDCNPTKLVDQLKKRYKAKAQPAFRMIIRPQSVGAIRDVEIKRALLRLLAIDSDVDQVLKTKLQSHVFR